MKPLFVFEGLDSLSEDQQQGLCAMVRGAIAVIAKHKDDPERGDVAWSKQDLEDHLIHAKYHVISAEDECFENDDAKYSRPIDSDGLPHIDHATARIALYYAKKRLLNAT